MVLLLVAIGCGDGPSSPTAPTPVPPAPAPTPQASLVQTGTPSLDCGDPGAIVLTIEDDLVVIEAHVSI